MSFSFREDFAIKLPEKDFAESFFAQESATTLDSGLIVEIAAIHAGATANYTIYPEDELKMAIASWVSPYPKPVIMNHDLTTEPVGRVIGAKMDKEESGQAFIRIQAAIIDPMAVQKVMDKRYITGSIGGKADSAVCTICGVDWANSAAGVTTTCVHSRGKTYDGQTAMLRLGDLSFKEYSFVNAPADSQSYIRGVDSGKAGADESWVKAPKFFIFSLKDNNMKEYVSPETISTFIMGESESTFLQNIIELDVATITGASLFVNNENVSNTNEIVQTLLSQEPDMQDNEVEAQEQDDILAVTEQLADDLAAEQAKETEETDAEATAEAEADAAEESEESDDTVAEEDTQEEAEEAAEETEEDDADEADDSEDEAAEEAKDEKEDDAEEEAPAAEESDNGELNATEDIESQVASLKAELDTLKTENTKLRKALHKTLAERVVDTKIALGLEDITSRSEAIEEHATRSASSLADSLRDLSKMPKQERQAIVGENLEVSEESNAVVEEEVVDGDATDAEESVDPHKLFAEKMADVLLGKTNLH